MFLPEYVKNCIDRLENAGYPCYAVGGCVRDACLGLTPHDYDLCTAATPEQMKALFSDHGLVTAGEKHGTVGILTESGVVEITTFRTEGGYADNRHPQWVRFVDSIEGDLSRRDFTVNAMAYSPTRGFADPFGGRQDLENRILRAVGDPVTRFQEDSLRILRGVRFAVRFGLTVDSATMEAMVSCAPLMDNLARERVFDELCKLLPLVTAQDLLTFAPVLTAAIPELEPMVGFDQRTKHHLYDIYTHTALVTGAVPAALSLRWAALLHDIGKPGSFTLDENGQGHYYGHAGLSAQMADAVLRRLKAPTALRQRVVLLIEKHMIPLTADKKLLRRRLSQYGEEALLEQWQLQKADVLGTGVHADTPELDEAKALIDDILAESACLTLKDLAVDGNDLMALGYSGKAIGETLKKLLEMVIDEQVENEKEALLNALKEG